MKTALLLLAAIILSGCAATTKNQPIIWSSELKQAATVEIGFREDGVIVWREVVIVGAPAEEGEAAKIPAE